MLWSCASTAKGIEVRGGGVISVVVVLAVAVEEKVVVLVQKVGML